MLIRDVRIENVRGFGANGRSVNLSFGSDDALPRWIVVAGRNGAGKSTFLQAIALAIVGPSAARVLAESFNGWIRDDADEAVAAARLQFSDSDGWAAGRRTTFQPWAGIRWTRQDGPEPSVEQARIGGKWSPARGPWADNPRGWFLAGYGPFRRLSPAPTEAQRLMMIPGRPAGLASLFREDASLSEAIQWLQQVYLRRLERRSAAEDLENVVLGLLDDGLLPEGMKVVRIDSEGLWVRSPRGGELPLRSLSDGYRTVAALVLDIVKQLIDTYGELHTMPGDATRIIDEGVVLIDEIDVHLHVSWQQRIGFWLKDHFPNVQFFVSTHSPFICQAADPGGLVRLPAPGEQEPAEIVSGERFARVVNGSADDAVLTDLFGLEQAVSWRALALREEIARLESAMIASNRRPTAAEVAKLGRLREQLPQSPTADVADALHDLVQRLDR